MGKFSRWSKSLINAFVQALEMDAADRPVEAADAYERVVTEGVASIEAYRNLVALYVGSLDPGYSDSKGLESTFLDRAAKRIPTLIKESRIRFGQDAELEFWSRYFRFGVLGEDWNKAFPQDFLATARRTDSLVPCLALFLSEGGAQYIDKVRALLETTSTGKTLRERGLHSLAEAALAQHKRR